MSETVTLAGYDWFGVWLIPIVALAVLLIGVGIDAVGDMDGFIAAPATMLALGGGIIWLAFGYSIPSNNWDNQQRIAAIEERGYSDVAIDGDKFTASDDGIYKSGAFVQIDGDQWMILEAK